MKAKKGWNIELTTGQFDHLCELMMDAYNRGYDQKTMVDTQTFDNLSDAICNAKETYLS
jgi:hypothetical protein|tara:strand:- start:4125 stop:4301 length:177 start_codon:yes stop_codon:yes gene_type:complete